MNDDKASLFERLSGMLEQPSRTYRETKAVVTSMSEAEKKMLADAMNAARGSSIKHFEEQYQTQLREELKNARLITNFELRSFDDKTVANLISAADENGLIPAVVYEGHKVGDAGVPAFLPYSPYTDEGVSWMAGWLSGHMEYETLRREQAKSAYDAKWQTREDKSGRLSQEQMKAFLSQPAYEREMTGERKIAAGLHELLNSSKGKL